MTSLNNRYHDYDTLGRCHDDGWLGDKSFMTLNDFIIIEYKQFNYDFVYYIHTPYYRGMYKTTARRVSTWCRPLYVN